MRARLFALLILLLLIGIPLIGYWYFFLNRVSGLSLVSDDKTPFSVHLEGTLKNTWLPLADSLLIIDRECVGSCDIRPMAPIEYTITLTSSGKVTIRDTMSLPLGETLTRNYYFTPDVLITPIAPGYQDSEKIGLSLAVNANKRDPHFSYNSLFSESSGSTIALRESADIREIGELTYTGFRSIWRVPEGVGYPSLDITGKYIVAPLYTDSTIILSRDFQMQKEVKIPGIIAYASGSVDRFLTASGVILSYRGSYGENPRFTDWIDASPTVRIGYISAEDSQKLALSNYPLGESVLIRLDRTTGQSQVLRKGLDIRFFYFSQGIPAYVDHSGNSSTLFVQ